MVAPATGSASLPQRMQESFARFQGKILVIMSGNDLTAREFSDLVAGSSAWQKLIKAPRVRQHVLAEANHTFSRNDWRNQVAGWTVAWVKSW